MMQSLGPVEIVALAEADEIVNRMSGEGRRLEEIAVTISRLPDGPPASWLMDRARSTVAEVKQMRPLKKAVRVRPRPPRSRDTEAAHPPDWL
jgi:hypothetical protein